MSRHRDVRNMDYTDDYDGYDDVYGHSVDDDYYISPSNRQFIYNRENGKDQAKIVEFMQTETDIKEDDDGEIEQAVSELSDMDKAKLQSCIDQINSTLGPTNISKNEIVKAVLNYDYNAEKALNFLLDNGKPHSTKPDVKDKDETNTLNLNNKTNNTAENAPHDKKSDLLSYLSATNRKTNTKSPKFIIPKLKTNPVQISSNNNTVNFTKTESDCDTLNDLISNHLNLTSPPNFKVQPSKKEPSNVKGNETSDSVIIKLLGTSVEELKIADVRGGSKSLTTLNKNKIDLSKALKVTSSLPVFNKNQEKCKSEEFSIPFIECDAEPEQKRNLLLCTLDVKSVLSLCYFKSSSSDFGKILCRKYKSKRVRRVEHECDFVKRMKRFEFGSPSPDDFHRQLRLKM